MRRNVTAEPIPIKFCTSTPWGDVVIYLSDIEIGPGVWEGRGCEIWPLPLTFALASNTAYCAAAHTRDHMDEFTSFFLTYLGLHPWPQTTRTCSKLRSSRIHCRNLESARCRVRRCQRHSSAPTALTDGTTGCRCYSSVTIQPCGPS